MASEPLTDEAIDAVWSSLEAKRREWDLEGLEVGDEFTTSILGGKWTKENKGQVYDAIKSQAKKGLASAWCRQYGLNVEASFSFRKFGEEAAKSMAIEWCRIHKHFFDIYTESDEAMHVYSAKELESCKDNLEFVNMVLAAGVESPIWNRAQGIRKIRPNAVPTKSSGGASSSSSK